MHIPTNAPSSYTKNYVSLTYFAVFRRTKSIRRSVTQPVLQSLMVALVLSRLDYRSTVLFGLPQQLVEKLQSIQNAAARLIFAARRRDHINPLLQGLHWLRVADRITFRLAVLTYHCLHSSAPEYLSRQLGFERYRYRVSADINGIERYRYSVDTYVVLGHDTGCLRLLVTAVNRQRQRVPLITIIMLGGRWPTVRLEAGWG